MTQVRFLARLPIFIRLIHQRKIKELSTGEWVHPIKEWDKKKCKIKAAHPNSSRADNRLKHIFQKVYDIGNRIEDGDLKWGSVNLKSLLGQEQGIDFYAFSDELIKQLKSKDQFRTAQRYTTITKKLRDYNKQKTLSFSDITPTYLKRYESHLFGLGNRINTIHTNIKTIRAILYEGIRQGHLPQEKNPFMQFKLKLETPVKVRPNADEIRAISELQLSKSEGKIYHTRNAYMFSLYCAGIRAGDLMQLTWKNVNGDILSYTMDKTKQPRLVKLIGPALEILELYKHQKTGWPIFPFLTKADLDGPKDKLLKRIGSQNAVMNNALKKIVQRAEIDKELTMHTARHGFAELARKRNVDVYKISKALGHSSIAITERYLASFDMDAMEETMEQVFGEE